MAITNITITQNNIVGASNLLPVHSPLAFIVDVEYTDIAPDVLNVEIYDDADVLLEEARCIAYDDPTASTRRFVFKASQMIRSLMDDFDDTIQANESFVHVPNRTKELKLKFVDPDNELMFDEQTFVFLHGSAQFSEDPNKDAVFDNNNDIYYAKKDGFVYVYFYNDDPANVVSVNGAYVNYDTAVDYDDIDFTDYDDEVFQIL